MTFILTEKQKELRTLFSGTAKNLLIYGGARSGKTAFLIFAMLTRAIRAPGSRHIVFRKHGVTAKQSIALDTLPKIISLAYPDMKYDWKDRDGYFKFENGSEIWISGLDDQDRVEKVLGKEYSTLYFNEASEIPLASYIVAQTRLAQQVADVEGNILPLRNYLDLNPTTRAHWTYRLFVDGINPDGNMPIDLDNYKYARANPMDNIDNLSEDYVQSLRDLPERQRRRFYEGEYSSDDVDALWRREFIKRTQNVPDLTRIVVAIDPAVTNTVGSDETGIIVTGMDAKGFGYVLEDGSGKFRPEEWAKRAISLYDKWDADRIIAERNNGGDMVEATIRSVRADVPYTSVWASRGKVTRAEPIAALYERGKIFHIDIFSSLEDQMCTFTIGGDGASRGYSPDRVDALCWGFSELFPTMTKRKNTMATILHIPTNYPMARRSAGHA